MADHADLVEQVKGIQRSSQEGKQAWLDYATEHLEEMKDPNRHDVDVLEDFIASYNRGDLKPSADRGGKAGLVEKVKRIQRSGQEGQEAWHGYCAEWLEDVRDPNKHDAGVLQEFVESYDGPIFEPGSRKGGGGGGGKGGRKGGGKGGKGGGKGGKGGGGGTVAASDAIRGMAMLSKDFRKAWVTYCKLYGEGVNDPAMHEEDFLIGFADFAGGLITSNLEGGQEHEREQEQEQPAVAAAGQKRPAAGAAAAAGAAPPAKKKVTIKKAVAEKIQEMNSSGALLAALRLPAVAPALAQLDEASALETLSILEEQAGEVEDPNEFVKNQVKFSLEGAGEE